MSGIVMSGRRPLIKGHFGALRSSRVRSCLRPLAQGMKLRRPWCCRQIRCPFHVDALDCADKASGFRIDPPSCASHLCHPQLPCRLGFSTSLGRELDPRSLRGNFPIIRVAPAYREGDPNSARRPECGYALISKIVARRRHLVEARQLGVNRLSRPLERCGGATLSLLPACGWSGRGTHCAAVPLELLGARQRFQPSRAIGAEVRFKSEWIPAFAGAHNRTGRRAMQNRLLFVLSVALISVLAVAAAPAYATIAGHPGAANVKTIDTCLADAAKAECSNREFLVWNAALNRDYA